TRRALSFADDHLEHGRAVFGDASDFDHVDLLRGARLPRTSAESRFAERNDGGRRTAARSMSGSSLRAHLKGAEWSSNGCSDNRRSNPWVDREHGATLTKHHRLVHHRSLADENVLLARRQNDAHETRRDKIAGSHENPHIGLVAIFDHDLIGWQRRP